MHTRNDNKTFKTVWIKTDSSKISEQDIPSPNLHLNKYLAFTHGQKGLGSWYGI